MYSGWLGACCRAFLLQLCVQFFALASLACHACASHVHPGAPGTAGVTAFTAIAGGVVVCVIIDMRVFHSVFRHGYRTFLKKQTRGPSGVGGGLL